MQDEEFIEEGTIRRKLMLVNGNLVEIERGKVEFSDNFSGLVRGTKSGKLYYKHEVRKR